MTIATRIEVPEDIEASNADYAESLKAQVKTPIANPDDLAEIEVVNDRSAAESYAVRTADQLNGHIRTMSASAIEHAEAEIAGLDGELKRLEDQKRPHDTIRMRRQKSSDPQFAQTFLEKMRHALYVFMTFGAIGVAIFVVATFIQESGKSVEFMKDIWRAVAYAFPIVLASAGFTIRAVIHDDEIIMARKASRLLAVGGLCFVGWVVATAIVFIGAEGGIAGNTALADTSFLDDPQAPVDPAQGIIVWAQDIVRMLFPMTVTGSVLLILHVLGDVFLAAGISAYVILAGRKTRPVHVYQDPRAGFADDLAKPLLVQKAYLQREIGKFQGNITQIDNIKAEFVASVCRKVDCGAVQLRNRRATAEAAANQDHVVAILGGAPKAIIRK